jgi:hypothetical protein
MSREARIAAGWLARVARGEFEKAVEGQRFRHPDTGNQVLFVSLPPDEQAKIRARFQQEQPAEQKSEGKTPWSTRLVTKAQEVLDMTRKGAKNLVRFMSDEDYRGEVKTWFREKKADFKKKLAQEGRESKEMLDTFGKVLSGKEVDDEEKKAAVDQLKDIGKMAVLGTLAVAPLGPLDDVLLFVVTAGIKMAFPEFSWKPSSWRTPIEAAEGKDLADKIADRLYAGIVRVLEDPPEDLLMSTLEEMSGTSGE